MNTKPLGCLKGHRPKTGQSRKGLGLLVTGGDNRSRMSKDNWKRFTIGASGPLMMG